ncbi:MAG: excinuclease ABC subunit UvrC [Polyangiaceae bacterium]|nr:excinuclease ABC subunit UvrC [Polyangiaceae bacterium]MCE7893043.1 excinuclease ABC subunit UvrC [Sorangiineae bacterium PRO1]MCL4752091.1 excinuclease ABC subunit UvrC [Myxococcales bacterium]
MDLPEKVQDKLEALPARPGCYVFRDRAGAALYIGKAKSLRARVRSYFQDGGSDTRGFIPLLQKHLADFDTVVTGTEKEAAILENNLIKESRPRYNVKLRDDKEFLTLKLSLEHAWPRLELVRRPEPDKARYFGPYHSATAARRTLNLIEKHFQLRTCSDRELASRSRPCLQYQIKRCPAPCVYEVDRERYAQQIRAVSLFLDGRHDELSRELEARMAEAAQAMEYELAALYRDQLHAVRLVREAQRVVAVSDRDQDVLGLYREGDLVELSLLSVRGGRMVEASSFSHKKVELPDDELVGSFLREHYGVEGLSAGLIPDEVLVPTLPEVAGGVAEWLSERRQALAREEGGRARKVEIVAPERGPKRQLLELAVDNARHAFGEKQRAAEDMDVRLAQLQERLRLPALPRRIECVDISHLGGQDTVGAVVALRDGLPDKKRYRTYHVKGVSDGDDYGAMYEVLARRFRRGRAAEDGDDKAEWELPDLLVVDGGRGQLAVAQAAAGDLGLHELSVVGLAKERESPLGDKLVDRVYLPGQKNPIALRPQSTELFLLARARDEAHRFSNRGRKKLGKKRRFESELDRVKGIGDKTKKALLDELGSVQGVREASDEAILAVPGVTRRQLAALRQHFAESG